ncbi:MAG: B12-binding domain-containing radical SAM protein [Actinobacteria bacterium]|nr:B12-binding domain-containing radical SAM protein [Actinomycetota bacterium]
MKVHLIVPSKEGELYLGKALLAPLGIITVAAYTPEGVDVRVIDENVEKIDFNEKPDLVGITAMTATARRAYEIAERYRKAGVKVVLGGIHPSFEIDEASRHADCVVAGEAEELWPKVVEDAMHGRLKPLYKMEGNCDLSRPKIPRRDLLKRGGYWALNNIQTSRGCPHDCSFCSVTEFNGRKVRFRDIDNVLAEVETVPVNRVTRKKTVAFIDDNIAASASRAKNLFKELKPLKITWGSQACITMANDEELVALAAESGCRFLFVGLETVSKAALREIGKHQNKVEEYARSLKVLRKYGIQVMGAFMFGFDSDDESVFEDTLEFAVKNKLQIAQFSNLNPLPGTRLYNQLIEERRIEQGYWLEGARRQSAVFRPGKINAYKLVRNTHDVSKRFYSYKSMARRLRPNNHLVYYFLANMLYHYSSYERSRMFRVPAVVPGRA